MGCYPSKFQIRTLSQHQPMWELSKKYIKGARPGYLQQSYMKKDLDKVGANERRKYPACCMVRIESTINGKTLQGSGSFCAKNVILTCAHILYRRINGIGYRAEKVFIFVFDGQRQIPYQALYFQYHGSHQETNQEIAQKYDYGIIVLKQNLDYGYLGVIQDWEPKQNYKVLNMSFPVVVTKGQNKLQDRIKQDKDKISIEELQKKLQQNKRRDLFKIKQGQGKIENQGNYFYQYDFSMSKGSSGSPIYVKMDQDYQIIGIHLSSITIEDNIQGKKTINRGLKFTRRIKQSINKMVVENGFKLVSIKQQINKSNINHITKQLTKQTSLSLISQLIIKVPKGQFKGQSKSQELGSEGLKELSHLPFLNIKLLSLTNNKIQAIPTEMYGFKSLIQLRIIDNPIRKIQNLEAMPLIQILQLNNNQISKMQNLAQLKNLESLSIINNKITTIENIEELKKLSYLNLINNKIQDFKNLQKIENPRGIRPNAIQVHLDGNPICQGIDQQYKIRIAHLKLNSIHIILQ